MTVQDVDEAREKVLEHFRWIEGDADLWSTLRDAASLRAIIVGLTSLAAPDRPDFVVGIESRGFVLAPAVAMALGVGFIAVRKDGALFPGPLLKERTAPDYRGNERILAVRRDHLESGSRLVLVDDWIETGSQAGAVARLARLAGVEVVSIVTVIDQATGDAGNRLPPIHAILNATQLPSSTPHAG